MNDSLPKRWVGGICVKEDKILLVHVINKEKLIHREYFLFPGDIVEDDETIENVLRSEFTERGIISELGDLLYSTEGDESEYYYLCLYRGDLQIPKTFNNEESSDKIADAASKNTYDVWVPLDELDELIVYPETVKNKIVELYEDGTFDAK